MNLSQVRELVDGDEVEFHIPFFPFTVGKRYVVRKPADIGSFVTDDNGVGRSLAANIPVETHFRKAGGL